MSCLFQNVHDNPLVLRANLEGKSKTRNCGGNVETQIFSSLKPLINIQLEGSTSNQKSMFHDLLLDP